MKNLILTIVAIIFVASGYTAFAALSASISASPSTVIINQPLTASIAISNTSASALTLSALQISASYNGNNLSRVPAAFSQYNPSSVVLGANATTTVPMSAVFFAPSTGVTGAGTGKYYIGATFSTSDGSITSAASGASVTVNPLPLPASEKPSEQ